MKLKVLFYRDAPKMVANTEYPNWPFQTTHIADDDIVADPYVPMTFDAYAKYIEAHRAARKKWHKDRKPPTKLTLLLKWLSTLLKKILHR